MATSRFIVLRHGETEWNRDARYQGHLDSPLTPLGLAQSRALAERLKGYSISALYSSDLGRARATAQIIADQIGLDIEVNPRLRERNLGIFQGLTKIQVKQKFPVEYRLYKSGDVDYVVPQGESIRQRFECVVGCFNELAIRHSDEQIAVVTHAGVLTAMLRHVLGLPLEWPRRFTRLNASWNAFVCEGGKWLLQTWGDVSHLEGITFGN